MSTAQTQQQQTKAPPNGRTEKTIAVNVEGKSRQIVIQKDETTAQILARRGLKDYQLSMGASNPLHNNLLNPGDVVFNNVVENEVLTAIPPVAPRKK